MIDLLGAWLGGAQAATPSYPPDHDYWYGPRVGTTTAGVAVDEDTALTFSTVFACVNKLAKTLATLPAHVYEKLPDGNRREMVDNAVGQVWTRRFNEEVLALAGREALLVNILLWGNAYAECTFGNITGELGALRPLLSREVTPVRSRRTHKLEYEYRPRHEPDRMISAAKMLHIPGLSLNGIVGLSVIGYQREAVAMAMAATKHGTALFKNGAIPGTVLQQAADQPELGRDGQKQLVDDWNEQFMGQDNQYRTGFLADGITATFATGMPMKDAQFLESRQFQRVELCGIFDVPPTKIHDDTRSTYSNVEQQNMDWKSDSLIPHCVRLEQAVGAKFFGGTPLYLKHNLDGLVRGDFATRTTGYQKMVRVGWSVNDILRLEDRNGIGPEGDVRFVTKDLIPLEQAAREPEPPPIVRPALPRDNDGDDREAQQRRQQAFARLFREAAGRLVAKEVKAVGNAWRKHGKANDTEGFLAWADKFYADQLDYAWEAVLPIWQSHAEVAGHDAVSIDGYGMNAATEYADTSLQAIRKCVAESPERLLDELKDWSRTKADTLAGLWMDSITRGA